MLQILAIRAARPLCIAALSAFAVLSAASSGAWAQDAATFIQHLGTRATEVMAPSVPPEVRTARFRQLFENDFDLPAIARFVLGPNARRLAPAQREEFETLFRENLVRGYSRRLAQYEGQPFRVTASRSVGDETVVSSTVQRSDGAPVQIDWHVVDRDGRLLITDVVIDGVSQRLTERNELAAIVQRNGDQPDAVLAALRQQLPHSGAPTTGSPVRPPG